MKCAEPWCFELFHPEYLIGSLREAGLNLNIFPRPLDYIPTQGKQTFFEHETNRSTAACRHYCLFSAGSNWY